MDVTLDKLILLSQYFEISNIVTCEFKITVNDGNINLLSSLYLHDFIEEIKSTEGNLVHNENINNYINNEITIEFLKDSLQKIGFYITFNDFVVNNTYVIPSEYFIYEIKYSSLKLPKHNKILKFESIVKLINNLIEIAKFESDISEKLVYIFNDNKYLELSFDNIDYTKFLIDENVSEIDNYLKSINSYKEKKSIFIKELIEFLTPVLVKDRFSTLLENFEDFINNCETSFEYYLSNFSFNKIQNELDTAVLDQSKNIRGIINDSQSKLIAIPAAFVLAISQIDFNGGLFNFKNFIVIISSFLFSYILSIFIKNQLSALEIITDNINNYKSNYQRSKSIAEFDSQELVSIKGLITKSFNKIDNELLSQKGRLRKLLNCNWAVSIILFLAILFFTYKSELKTFFLFVKDFFN